MDNYKIRVYKNDEKLLESETAFPTFVGEDYSVRFAALELLTEIISSHPKFIDDIYDMLVKENKKINGDR